MRALLTGFLNIAIIVFAVTSMLSVGLAHSARQILAPLRDLSGALRALLANFVLVPILALIVTRLASLQEPVRAGLLLVAVSAGAPFLIKLTEVTEGPIARSATLLVLLLPATIVYTPLVVPLVLPQGEVKATTIATPLLLTLLLPLALGLLVRRRRPNWARRLHPLARMTSTVALVAVVLATLLAYFPEIVKLFRQAAVLPSLALVAGAFVIGYVLGGPDRDRREVLGLATSQRNIGAATVVAARSFDDPATLTMVVMTSLIGFGLLFPVAWALRRRRRSAPSR